MLRYEKQFSLGDKISFSDFLHALEEMYFVNYGVMIEKTPSENKYRIELVTHLPMIHWGLENAVNGKVVLSEGEILYSTGSQNFTIRAWAKGANLFSIWLFFILAILGWAAILYIMYTEGTLTIDMFIGLGLMFLPLAPHWLVYRRDKDMLNRIGALGKSLEKK